MQIGPVQLLVIGYDSDETHPGLRAELERLRAQPGIRLIDLLHVRKHADGRVERIEVSDLSDAETVELGATIGALIGLGAGGEAGAEQGAIAGAEAAEEGRTLGDDLWYVDEAIPPGTAATVALIEHRWAIGLRDALREAGGTLHADAWVHPTDLVAIGLVTAAEAEAELAY
ncbi:MAG TPA: hypothetical protein VHX62_02095 [Solirubrobacteraceae bacterium]|jgi:uncharacterized membrane protein|nr:hypothetical protein [Solirubrobacteraceae bacterium]